MKRISLTRYLVEQQRADGTHPGAAAPADRSGRARLQAHQPSPSTRARWATCSARADTENVQGEVQKKLDIIANEVLIEANEWGGHLAAMASRGDGQHPRRCPTATRRANTCCCSIRSTARRNIDVNVSRSAPSSRVLKKPGRHARRASEADFLQPGSQQVAAGYCVYGPQTTLVLTVGDGVAMFTLDREQGSWVLTQEDMRIPEDTKEFAINM